MVTITIDPKRCKACGYCAAFCPREVYASDSDGKPIVTSPESCVACQLCVKRCPDFAVKVEKENV